MEKQYEAHRIIHSRARQDESHHFYISGHLNLLMSNKLSLARAALLLALLFVITPGNASGAGLGEGEFPELAPDDPAPVYIWNIPLKLVLLDFIFMTAPALLLPVQILIAAGAWFWLGHRRISRKNALEHDTRRAAYLCIRENPGINRATLSCKLGINIGTLRYHLATLCETRKVRSEHAHGLLRYYANGRATGEEEDYFISGARKQILDLLAQDPGMTRTELASALGIAGSSVAWHIALLIREEAVRSEKDGRRVRYFPRLAALRYPIDRGVDATG